MRESLVFTGIKEVKTEENNCETVLTSFLKNEMEVNYDIEFEIVHRTGKNIDTGG